MIAVRCSLLQLHVRIRNSIHLRAYDVICVIAVCCSVLQCVVVCCSVLQCVAVCCSVLQCVAIRCTLLQCVVIARPDQKRYKSARMRCDLCVVVCAMCVCMHVRVCV